VTHKSIGNWSCLALVITDVWMTELSNLFHVRVRMCASLQLDESKTCYFLNL